MATEDSKNLIICSFQIDQALAVKARIVASSLNISRSELVRRALANEIERQAAEKKEVKLYA